MALPPDLAQAADSVDMQMDKAAKDSAPVVTASPKALNRVVRAYNELAPMFGAPPYPDFTEPMQGDQLPADFVKALSMIQAAAAEADVPVPSMPSKMDDGDLQVLAGELTALARDRDFTRYLKSKPAEERTEDEPSVGKGVMMQEEMSSPADDMSLFASRIK